MITKADKKFYSTCAKNREQIQTHVDVIDRWTLPDPKTGGRRVLGLELRLRQYNDNKPRGQNRRLHVELSPREACELAAMLLALACHRLPR